MAAIRRPERERFWREKFKRFQRSSLSLNAFCRQEKINRHTFKSWIYVLMGRDGAEATRQLKSKRGSRDPLSPAEREQQLSAQRAVVRRWKDSGLTQTEFCKLEGLRLNQLSYWKKVVAKHDNEAPDSSDVDPENLWSIKNFVPVALPSSAINTSKQSAAESRSVGDVAPGAQGQKAELPVLRSGVFICVFAGADAGALRSVFAAIKESWSC